MIYVPDEWIKHKENEEKIFKLLEKLDNDIVEEENKYSKDDAIKELEDIDELIVITKLKNDQFSFGS